MKKLNDSYLSEGRYTASDLREVLAKNRGHPVPKVTLKKWRYHLGISPDENLLYTEFDRDALNGLVNWLKRGGRIKVYVQQFQGLIQEHMTHGK